MLRRYTHLFSPILLTLLLILTGCRADEPNLKPKGMDTDGKTYLNLLIPSATMARNTGRSRGNEDDHLHQEAMNIAEEEGKINSLYVIGFYTTKDKVTKHFFLDLDDTMGTPVEGIYISYNIEVEPNVYDLYVVANVRFGSDILGRLNNKNLTGAETDKLKADLNKLHLNKIYHKGVDESDSENEIFTTAKGLPMSSHLSADVKEGNKKSIVAPMQFICAKVRLTVVYDSTEGGFSQPAYGTRTPLEITGLDALNVYLQPRVFTTKVIENDIELPDAGITQEDKIPNIAAGKYYDLASLNEYVKDAAGIKKLLEQSEKNPLDGLTEIEGQHDYTRYAWQSVCYLPECENTETPTKLKLNAKKNGTELDPPFLFTPGCDGTVFGTNETSHPLRRGHYYDIVARVSVSGDIQLGWKITPWTPIDQTIMLSGTTMLTLGTDRIESINGEDGFKLPYTTNAPYLDLQSSYFIGPDKQETNIPVFLLKVNEDDGTIDIRVNGEIGSSKDAYKNAYFWITAGNIRKQVWVEKVIHDNFLTILPTDQTVYASQVADELNYPIVFQYTTNTDDMELDLTEYDNPNTKKCNGSTADTGFYWEVCVMPEDGKSEDDLVSISRPIPFKSGFKYSDYRNSNYNSSKLPKNGYIRLIMKEPADPEYFSRSISGTFTASSDAVEKPSTGTFNIVARPKVYTIHFKTKDITWDNPHIYVYQELEYDGIPVYGDTNEYTYLEYNFTGKLSFKGWAKHGGEVPNLTQSPTTGKVPGFASREHYNVSWGSAYVNSFKPEQYDLNTYLLPESYFDELGKQMDGGTITDCKCKDKEMAQLWPGVAMLKEGTDGWYKIELPLIAKPGKARIMFADGHGGSNDDKRHPQDKMPGILLPDYADCEAWFLLDKDKYNTTSKNYEGCEFANYQRESYSGQVVEPMVKKKVLFRWPQFIGTGKIEYKYFYLFKVGGGNVLNGWDGNPGTGPTNGYYTYTHNIPEETLTALQTAANGTGDAYKFSLYYKDNGDQKLNGGDEKFNSTLVKELKGSELPAGYDAAFELHYEDAPAASTTEYYLIAWPTSWGGDKCFLYDNSGNTKPFGGWNDEANKEKYKAYIGSTEYYFKWETCDKFNNISWDITAGWKYCIIYNGTNKKDNYQIKEGNAEILNISDIPSAVINAIPGTVKAAIKLK